ncbi:leucine-rich repeat-containing protein 15-like [Littorina saxatilis]|uniref:leucine-rich repeat-containing protein 15-like n=1 Tax=Littorina saxatilis TaxID=31220 RepID=UPI0038B43210
MWWLQQLVVVVVLGTIVMLTTTATTTVRAVTHSTPHPAAATTRRPWPDSGYGPTPSPRDVHNSASSQPSPSNATTNNTSSSDSNQRSNRSNSVSGLDFSCPAQMCDCYVLRPELKIWLNCTVPRLQGTEQQRALFRAIPAQGSAIMTITCSTPARSYLYNDMISQLTFLQQLNIVNCKFHDIPKDVFRGLDLLEVMFIDGANLLGHVDPLFASHLPLLRLLEIIRSRVTFLPPLCRSSNLRTLNVSYNHIADFDHAGVHCVSSPLSKLEILDVNYNDVSSIPAWLGRSVPNLIRLSSGDNAIREVGAELCGELPSLGFLDLSFNALHDVDRVELANCSQLSILALAANPLGALPPRSVEFMPSLQRLYLFSMGLNDNVWDKLSHLKHLQVLDLQNNSLVTVPPLVMREFPSLDTLNLSANFITLLPKKALVGQYGLRSLDLSGNGMQQLPRQAFGNLRSLLELRLSNNSISDVDQTTFTGLRALVMLNFSHNYLRQVFSQGN